MSRRSARPRRSASLVAAIVLVITFGSLVAAGMTMLNALIGVGVGMAGLFALSGVIELTSTAPILALMLGLAVGIDYSLFITSRHRQNLLEGLSPEEAVGRAVGTAGSAVVFAGATVVIALAGLAVVKHPVPHRDGSGRRRHGHRRRAGRDHPRPGPARLRRRQGAAAQAASTVDAAAPRSRRPTRAVPAEDRSGFGFRWARLVTRLRVPVILVALLGLGLLALPAPDMRLALPDASTAAEGSPARVSSDLIREGFGPGFTGRLAVVVDGRLAAGHRGRRPAGDRADPAAPRACSRWPRRSSTRTGGPRCSG